LLVNNTATLMRSKNADSTARNRTEATIQRSGDAVPVAGTEAPAGDASTLLIPTSVVI
jgi:hypothetical protein